MQSSLLYQSECILAEGPLWHPVRQSFFWVDIDGKCFYEMNWATRAVKKHSLDFKVSLLAETTDPDLLLIGVQGGLASFNLATEKLSWLLDIEKEESNNRPNDGGCDPLGRLWLGTMDCQCLPGKGSLYYIDQNLHLHKKLSKVTVSNGIVWDPFRNRMYYTDSPTQQVQSFFFDPATGETQFEKICITIDREWGCADGMCLDAEGMLWIAQWDGFGVYRWNPANGEFLDKIELPVPQVSSCAFGGTNLDQLLITTARENMTEEDISKYPLSGNLFIAEPGVKGIKIHKFGI